jgi:hypothetical protein
MIVVFLLKKKDEDTSVKTALEERCGALNIQDCSIPRSRDDKSGYSDTGSKHTENSSMSGDNYARKPKADSVTRWPANVVIASSTVSKSMDTESGVSKGTGPRSGEWGGKKFGGEEHNDLRRGVWPNDSGGASRFFKKVKK